MTTLTEIRDKYPQYRDLSDGQFMDAMYNKHYSDIPRSEFDKKMGVPAPSEQPTESKPILGDAADLAMEPLRGFNKGWAGIVTAPYRGLDWLIEKGTGGNYGLPDIEKTPLWGAYLNQPETKSKAADYIRAAGEGIGAASVPLSATFKAAEAAPALTRSASTLGGLWDDTLAAVRSAPGAAAATDIASGAGSGIGAQAAKDMGFGLTGQLVGSVVGGGVPGGIAAYRTPGNAPIGSQTAQSMARRRADEAARDAEAFADLDVRPFGPAFNQGPVASIGKQVTETPILGAPLKNNFDETVQDAANAARRIADDISGAAMPEAAGRNIQQGLERYGRQGLRAIDEDRLTNIGVNPQSPIQAQIPMSNEARNRLNQAETIRNTERAAVYNQAIASGATPEDATRLANQQVRPLAQSQHNAVLSRRGAEDMSDDELSRIIAAPSVDTSFRAKQEALYEHAWRQIPVQMTTNSRRNPQLVATQSMREALDNIQGQIGNQISGQGTIDGALAARFMNAQSNFTLPQLRAVRTEIGRAMDEYNPTQQTLSQSQLRSLYGAISRDIEVGIQDLANRALINSRLPPTAPNYVPPDVANQAARALRYFQRADGYTRAGMERMERFNAVLGTENPQQAAQRLITAATDTAKGNMQMVRAAANALRPEDRAEFSAMLVNELGRPVNSARGVVQEVGWSPNSFVTRYNNMSPEARNLFFDREHREALDNLFRVANRLSNVEALTNTSRSGTNTMNLGGMAAGAGSMMAGNFALPLAIGGSMASTAVLMSRPAYTNWMIRYMNLRAAVRDGSDQTIAPLMRHVLGLERMAHDNPALWPAYASVVADTQDLQPSGEGKSSKEPLRVTVTPPGEESRYLSQARNAIKRGASEKDVKERLRSLGIDPGKL